MEISVIIPAYNAEKKLPKLLLSLALIDAKTTEVIVVDDASTDGTRRLVKKFPWMRYVRQPENRGVAAARNRGGSLARGEVLLFLDADVRCFRDTIRQVVETYHRHPGLAACSGIIALPPRTYPFFARYKGIRTYAYWMLENRGGSRNQPFGNACGSVRKRVFQRMGGFDEVFRGASLEDADFGARLVQKGFAVGFNPKIRVKHRFENFLPMMKKYMHRSRVWTRLFLGHKSFESVGMTRRESVNGLLAGCVLPCYLLCFLFALVGVQPRLLLQGLLVGVQPLTLAHLMLARRFYLFVHKQAGAWFLVRVIGLQLFIYTLIYLSAASAALEVLLERMGLKKPPISF